MKDKSNNKDFILKRLIYRSKYTGTKETDILLSNFANKFLKNLTNDQLKIYETLLDSGDPRIWRLAIDNEKTVNEKESEILNLIKKSVITNDRF